jgi:ribulose-phosphate 3-epimerase
VREARALIDACNPACELEIDGGIGRKNIADVVAAGVDVCVDGATSIFGAPIPRRSCAPAGARRARRDPAR